MAIYLNNDPHVTALPTSRDKVPCVVCGTDISYILKPDALHICRSCRDKRWRGQCGVCGKVLRQTQKQPKIRTCSDCLQREARLRPSYLGRCSVCGNDVRKSAASAKVQVCRTCRNARPKRERARRTTKKSPLKSNEPGMVEHGDSEQPSDETVWGF